MKNIYALIFLYFSAVLHSQITFEAKVSKKEFTEHDDVVLSLYLEILSKDVVAETPLRMLDLSKFEIIGTGTNRNAYYDGRLGLFVDQRMYQFQLRAKKAGKFKIGSASVTVNDKIYHTEAFDVYVHSSERKSVPSLVPEVFLQAEYSDAEIYEYQPVKVVVKAYARKLDHFRRVKQVSFDSNADFTVVPQHVEKSVIEWLGDVAYQTLGTYLVYPKESGRLEIQPITAQISSSKHKIQTHKLNLHVKELPEGAPKSFDNAVGKFAVHLSSSASAEKIEVNRPVTVSLKVSGEGNMSDLVLPSLKKSKEYTFYPPTITQKLKPSSDNLVGELVADYVVIPKHSGELRVETQPFSFFDPSRNAYVELKPQSILFDVMSKEEILSSKSTLQRVNEYSNSVIETVDHVVVDADKLHITESKKIQWKTLALNFILFAFVIVLVYLLRKKYFSRKIENMTTVENPISTIADKEVELMGSLKSDVNDYFMYLKHLKEENRIDLFFSTVEELDQEVRNQYFNNSGDDFLTFLETHKGYQIVDEYRRVQQAIQIAKYAPFYQADDLDELLDDVMKLYTDISK